MSVFFLSTAPTPGLGLLNPLCPLDKVQSKAICLIKDFSFTKSFQALFRHHLVKDLSIFCRYFHRHCSQEIRDIIPVPLRCVRNPRSLFQLKLISSFTAYSTNSQIITNPKNMQFMEHLAFFFLNPTACPLSNLRSINLI